MLHRSTRWNCQDVVGGGVDSLSMGVSMGVGEEQVPRMCLISKAIVVGIRGYWVETLFYSYYY